MHFAKRTRLAYFDMVVFRAANKSIREYNYYYGEQFLLIFFNMATAGLTSSREYLLVLITLL